MNVKKILVPVDFSENSLNALKYAAGFAKDTGAEILLLHITDPDSLVHELRGNLSPEHLIGLIENEPFMSGIKTTAILKNGKIAASIVDESRLNNTDLIVMGTRGAGNAARNLFGTNTTKVIGKTECTVLVIPDEATYQPIRKIVMAVDMDKDSRKIIEEFIQVISIRKAAVLLAYVGTDEHGEFKKKLDKLTAELKAATGYEKIVSKIIESDEFPMMLEDFALNIEADMLVMISHHRGIFESIFDPSQTKLFSYHTRLPLMAIQQHKTPLFFF